MIKFDVIKFIPSSPLYASRTRSTSRTSSGAAASFLLWALVFHIMITLGSSGRQHPYGVSTTGIQGATSSGHDASAGGYAGSSLVAPLASSGYNSPLRPYSPAPAFPSNSYGFGFGGYANNGGGGGGSGGSSGYGGGSSTGNQHGGQSSGGSSSGSNSYGG